MAGIKMRKAEREAYEKAKSGYTDIKRYSGKYLVDEHTLQVYRIRPEKSVTEQIRELYTDLNRTV